jgi:indole-3-glycerol phosphate synthase
MMTMLDKIYEVTKSDLSKRKNKVAASDFKSFELYHNPRRDFGLAIERKGSEQVSFISEIKKASPSQGVIRDDFDPSEHAKDYIKHGASAISVLTDEPFFKGSITYLEAVSRISSIPILRKDFILDFYQVEEAKAYGADAILLIATMLEKSHLEDLHMAATEYGLQCLVECYDEADFEKISYEVVKIIGVNNRDLKTFKVDVHRGVDLLKRAPSGILTVSESGLSTREDIKYVSEKGVDAVLIGESFMRAKNPGKALAELINN